MPGLTVTEKSHWKERIARRIDKRIELISANDPNLMDRISRLAQERALESLGLTKLQAELAAIEEQEQELASRQEHVHRAMLAAVRRVPIAQVTDSCHGYLHSDVANSIERRKAVHEEELLAADTVGQEILRLRLEKENLLDTVWLATSGQQIKELWQKVVDLLGQEQTRLQKDALAIAPVQEA
jgi:K+-sensing histidine kinase KdpD